MSDPYPFAMCRASSDWMDKKVVAIACSPLATAICGAATSRMLVNAVSTQTFRLTMQSTGSPVLKFWNSPIETSPPGCWWRAFSEMSKPAGSRQCLT
jgi:hypothetical protein